MTGIAAPISTSLLSLFFSLPGVLVTLAIRLGPGGTGQGSPASFDTLGVPTSLAGLLVVFCLFSYALSVRGFSRFVVTVGTLIFLLASLMFYLGVVVHRDYFTAVFQYIMILPAVFLFRVCSVPEPGLSRGALRQLPRVGYVIAAFYVQWVMLMGYAISSRVEPRPAEAIAYNLYNLIIVLVLFLLSRVMEGTFFHHVRIGPHSVLVDGKDVGPTLGPKKVRMVWAFATAEGRMLRCCDLQRLDDLPLDGCDRCGEASTKAALCRKYRTTYNTLLEIKKALELLEIGTLLGPDNKRRVLTEGWTLSFFDNVRLRLQK